ncbi:hypothetical protein D3C85_1509710 [compost metagenome]
MLIVMEYRNFHAFTKFLFDIETFWRFNVFEVDTTESWLKRGNNIHDFIWIVFCNFDVKYVNTSKLLEENAFTFHYRFRSQWANIT